MYKLFYGLAEAPFNLTPDSKFLYMSRRHDEALTALLYGVSERKGFICVTGEIGSGKTTTLRALLARLDEETYSVATILNSYLTDLELLKTINEEFGLSGKSDSKKQLLDELNAFLVEQYRQGRNCVLILDESQNLRPDTLEQIRMISNLETEKDKLIQIVMVGQPELRRTLELPELEQLNQRITVRYHVGPLDEDEVPKYVYHRLKVAKAQEQIEFTPQAFRLIYHYSKGIPRRINVICDRCLLVGYVLARFDIDGDMVQQAVDEIRGVSQPRRPEVAAIQETETHKGGWRPSRQTLMMALAAVGVIAVGFLAGASFRSLTRARTPEDRAVAASDRAFSSQLVEDVMETSADQKRATPRPTPAVATPVPTATEAQPEIPAVTPEPTPPPPTPTPTPTPRPQRTKRPAPPEPAPAAGGAETMSDQAPPSASATAVEPWATDPQGVLRVDRAELAAPATYLQLLRQWGIEVDLEPFSGAPAEQVALYDMTAMVGQLDFRTYTTEQLNSALTFDLPIMIRHGAGVVGSAPTAAVLRRSGDRVEIADPQNGLKEVELDALAETVEEAVVMYHDPHGLTGLENGDTGESVETLQRTLTSLGMHEGKIDGIFGPQVREAVRSFQRAEGLSVTGEVDAATAALINSRIDPDRPGLSS